MQGNRNFYWNNWDIFQDREKEAPLSYKLGLKTVGAEIWKILQFNRPNNGIILPPTYQNVDFHKKRK